MDAADRAESLHSHGMASKCKQDVGSPGEEMLWIKGA